METRARYVAVGSFVILLLMGFVGFLIWMAKVQPAGQYNTYNIDFVGSVTGLSAGSPVNYRGVPVGNVAAIRLNPKNPDVVRVIVHVDKTLILREDTIASLEMQGITGFVFVQLSATSSTSPPLQTAPGAQYPTITSTPSSIEKLMTSAPQIMQDIAALAKELKTVLNAKNGENFSKSLENIQMLTANLNQSATPFNDMVSEASETMRELKSTLRNINEETDSISADVRATLTELKNASSNLAMVTQETQLLIQENRTNIRDFMNYGLSELTKTLTQTHRLMKRIDGIAQKLDRNPGAVWSGEHAISTLNLE